MGCSTSQGMQTSASEDELSDEESADDGVLAATDKEQIRVLCMDEGLDERDGSPVGVSVQGATGETEDDSDAISQDDQTISALRRVMEPCSQMVQLSFSHVASVTQRARQTEAGRESCVPTQAGKSLVEGSRTRRSGPTSEGYIGAHADNKLKTI